MKFSKILAFVLTAVMLLSCIGVCYASDLEGDVNKDGKINLSDCSVTLKYIAGWDMTSWEFYPEEADMNGDGKINLSDVSCIIRTYFNYWGG